MVRQTQTYLASAVSGTALLVAAVVAFVLLVSLQAVRDWPFAGLVSRHDANSVATHRGGTGGGGGEAPAAGGRATRRRRRQPPPRPARMRRWPARVPATRRGRAPPPSARRNCRRPVVEIPRPPDPPAISLRVAAATAPPPAEARPAAAMPLPPAPVTAERQAAARRHRVPKRLPLRAKRSPGRCRTRFRRKRRRR